MLHTDQQNLQSSKSWIVYGLNKFLIVFVRLHPYSIVLYYIRALAQELSVMNEDLNFIYQKKNVGLSTLECFNKLTHLTSIELG